MATLLMDLSELESTAVEAKKGKQSAGTPEWFAEAHKALAERGKCGVGPKDWKRSADAFRKDFKAKNPGFTVKSASFLKDGKVVGYKVTKIAETAKD
jgi:hypothetical protein